MTITITIPDTNINFIKKSITFNEAGTETIQEIVEQMLVDYSNELISKGRFTMVEDRQEELKEQALLEIAPCDDVMSSLDIKKLE